MRITQTMALLATALLAYGASAEVLGVTDDTASMASIERTAQETGTCSYFLSDNLSGTYTAARPDFTNSIYPPAAETPASAILVEPRRGAVHKRVAECACVGHSKLPSSVI